MNKQTNFDRPADAARSKNPSFRRQRNAVVILAAVALLLVGLLVTVKYLVRIYIPLTDVYYTEDGERHEDSYYIRKIDGVYALYDADGNPMERADGKEDIFIAKGSGNQYQIDRDTGEASTYARVITETEENEAISYSRYLLLYPQIQQTNVYSIEVTNTEGSYTFRHIPQGVYIEGFESVPVRYDQNLYAYLCVSCGYTLSHKKINLADAPKTASGEVDYAAYGLDTPQATFTVTEIALDEDGNKVTYLDAELETDLYVKGRSYTVHVGDKTLTDEGYYVQIDGSKAVYILTSDLAKTVLVPVESMITPQAVYTPSLTQSAMATGFYLAHLDDWLGVEEFDGEGVEPIVGFNYLDLSKRSNTIESVNPYQPIIEGMGAYRLNDTNVGNMLTSLASLEYLRCAKLGITAEDLEAYHLDKDVWYLTYGFDGVDYKNTILISRKTADGTYYVASFLYGMIVEVDQSYFAFLEWDSIDWYKKYFAQQNIAYLHTLTMGFGDETYEFSIDNSLTYSFYKSGGRIYAVDLTMGYLDENGKYVDEDGKSHKILFTLDFGNTPKVTLAYANAHPTEGGFFYIDASDNLYYRYADGKSVANVKVDIGSTNMSVTCDYTDGEGHTESVSLDYKKFDESTGHAGQDTGSVFTGRENFRAFYTDLLYFSLEGDVDEAEFERNMGMSVADYLASDGKVCQAIIRMDVEDMAKATNYSYDENNHVVVEIRFYRYSDLKSLVTVENLTQNEAGEWVSGEAPVGRFYVTSSYLDKLEREAGMVFAGELIK